MPRFAGALFRAALVAFLIAYPGLALPVESTVAIDLFGILALIGGAIVWLEYAFESPNILEFRYCPPFNRIRYASLMTLLVLLVFLFPEGQSDSQFHLLLAGLSKLSLYLWNFEFSPVPVLAVVLGRGDPVTTLQFARMAALALNFAIIYTGLYAIFARGFRSHLEGGEFNIYLNLPTTSLPADAVPKSQLQAIGLLSIVVGLTLPFFIPIFIGKFSDVISGQPMAFRPMAVWVIALWAWVPAIAVLRGIAMFGIASTYRKSNPL